MKSLIFAALTALITLPLAVAQTTAVTPGHWVGTIQLPLKSVQVAVDLVRSAKDEWTGSLAFPGQKTGAYSLSNVSVKGAAVSLESLEALVAFEGNLSPDGKAITGSFSSGSLRTVPVPMQLARVSEPQRHQAGESGTIPPESQGAWEGVLRIARTWEGDDPSEGITVRLRIELAAGKDGAATGVFTNLAEPKTRLPLSAVTQKGKTLRFELKSAGALYIGEVNGKEVVGEWSQFGANPLGLTLKLAGGE